MFSSYSWRPSSVGLGDLVGRLPNQLSQLVLRQPLGVGVAGVTEALGKSLSLGNHLALPPGVAWCNHIAILKFDGVARLIFGEQDFMEFLSGADSDGSALATRRQGVGEVRHSHARNLGDENFAAHH